MTCRRADSCPWGSIAITAAVALCVAISGAWAEPPGADGDRWLSRAAEHVRDAEYHVTWNDDAWQAPNRAQNLRTSFTEHGVRVVRRTEIDPSWELGLEFVRYGRGGMFEAAGQPRLLVQENRVEFDRGAVVEWYVNDRRGLEQGFTIQDPPGGDAELPVFLDLAMRGGLTARFSTDGQAVGFHAGGGIEKLHYGGLVVVDATERVLPSWLERSAGGLRILYADTDAVYPVTVDPVLKDAAWSAEGNQTGAGVVPNFGRSVAGAGDVNGDGFDDVIVSAPWYDAGEEDEGAVFVFYGSASGLSASPDWMEDGDQVDAMFGYAVSSAGDVNHDGYDDILVSAPYYDNGQTNEGLAFVYHGSEFGLDHTPDPGASNTNCPATSSADACAEADDDHELFGKTVAGIGDVNCDGFDDVIVATPHWGSDQGRAEVFLGSENGIGGDEAWSQHGNYGQAWFGRAVAGAGDVNGDGCDDFIVAEPNHDSSPPYPVSPDGGRVVIFYGYDNGGALNPFAPAVRFLCATQRQEYGLFGQFVGGAGNVNGDGCCDLDDSGTCEAPGELCTDRASCDLCTHTLFEFDDIVVGRPNYSSSKGQLFVYHGSVDGIGNTSYQEVTPEDLRIDGWHNDDKIGWSVRGASDVNGDGYDDIVHGAWGTDGSEGIDVGAVYVHHGSAAGLSPEASWAARGSQKSAHVGYAAGGAGDVNGDGYDDIIYGAPAYDGDKTDEGAAFVHHGAPEPLASALAQALMADSSLVPRNAQVKLYSDDLSHPLSGETYDLALGDNTTLAVSHGPVPNSVIISTGLAQDEGKGDTDFGRDGEPDYARLSFDLDVPSGAKTLVFTTQLVTSELKARPQDDVFDTHEIYFSRRKGTSWDGCSSCHANGDIPSKVINPPVLRGIGVEDFEEINLVLGVNDEGPNDTPDGRHDTAMIVSNLYFSEVALPEEGRDFNGDWLIDYLPNPSPQDMGLVTGTYSYQKELLTIPGVGLPFRFSIHYNSASGNTGAMGHKWSHSYEATLQKLKVKEGVNSPENEQQLEEIDHVLVRLGDGRSVYFECVEGDRTCATGPGLYAPKYAGTYGTLEENPARTFTYETKDHIQYVFREKLDQADGDLNDTYEKYALSWIQDASGNRITLNYDAEHRLDYVVDTRGKAVTFSYDEYDEGDVLTAVEHAAGGDASAQFEYVASVNDDNEIVRHLAGFTDLSGHETTFEYDAHGNILACTDDEGVTFVRNEYEEYQGANIEQVGDRVTARYNANALDAGVQAQFDGDTVTMRDRIDGADRSVYDAKGRVVQRDVFLGYDDAGAWCDPAVSSSTECPWPVSHDPCWATTCTQYDTGNKPFQTWDPIGGLSETSFGADGNLIWSSDSLGHYVRMRYDSNDNLIYRWVVLPGATSCDLPVDYPACSDISISDCFVTAYCYDTANHLTESYDSLGDPSSLRTYDSKGLVLSDTDQLGNVSDYSYNSDGYLELEKFPLPDPENLNDLTRTKVSYAYDDLGRITAKLVCDLTNATCDPATDLITEARYEYDPGGQLLSETDPAGRTTSYEYDSWDRITRRVFPGGADVLFGYTPTGRLETVENPIPDIGVDRSVTLNTFDDEDRLIAEQDPLQHTTHYTCDAADRLIGVMDPEQGSASATYDAAGNMLTFTDPEDNTTTFSYDALGRVETELDAAGNTVTTTYLPDARNLVASVATARRTIEYGYDIAGRLIDVDLWEGAKTSLVAEITHTPDANGNRTETTDTRFGGAIVRTFDGLGRLVTRTDPYGHTVGYTYDIVGNLIRLCYDFDVGSGTCNPYPYGAVPPSWEVRYEYDVLNRLTRVVDWDGRETVYTYDLAGNLETAALPDGSTVTYSYDGAHRLAGISDVGVTYSFVATYTLDAAGRRTEANITLADPPEFDGSPDSGDPFAYVANEFTGTTRNAEFDTDGNLTDIDLDRDADGPGGAVATRLYFDTLNQLVGVDEDQDDVPDVTYAHDADGYRVEAVRGATTRRYVHDTTSSIPRVLVERDGSGVVASYVYGLGLVSRHTSVVGALVYHFDSRGSTLALTGESGDVQVQYRYSPFGGIIDRKDDYFAGTFEDRNPFTYNGRDGVFDDGNGLYFMRTRYYAPDLMRFIQKDRAFSGSLEDPQSLNRYAFVRGDPINNVDPNGEWLWQAVSVAISVGFECLDGCTWQEAAGAAVEGLISSLPGGGVWGAIAFGALGNVAGNLIKGEEVTIGGVASAAAFGGLGGAAGKGTKGAFKGAAKGSRKAVNEGREAAFKVMKRNASRKAPKNVSAELQEQAIAGTREHARKRAIERYAETAAEWDSAALGGAVGGALTAGAEQLPPLPLGVEPASADSEPGSALPSPPVSTASSTTAPSGPPSPCR